MPGPTRATFAKAYNVTGSGPYTVGTEITGGPFDINDNDITNTYTAVIGNNSTDNGYINVADTTASAASLSGGQIVGVRTSDNGVLISGTNANGDYVTIFFANSAQSGTITLDNTAGNYTYCFLAGTQIATPTGLVAVETLAVGDEISTVDGGVAKVRFNFIQQRSGHVLAGREHFPIKICAGALADNVPSRDLYVTPDHAIYLPEWKIFVEASILAVVVNDTSMYPVRNMPESFTYYHILCDNQEIVLAENTPAETFIDNVTMEQFDNYADYVAMYPQEHFMEELDIPRGKAARQLPKLLKQQLNERAQLLFPMQLAA